jgi:hypothetical protein
MGTEFQEVLCDDHGIGGDCEYCGDNVLNHEASGDKYVLQGFLRWWLLVSTTPPLSVSGS